jgi:hypothetical protein
MARFIYSCLWCVLFNFQALCQENSKDTVLKQTNSSETDTSENSWSFSATLWGYIVPTDRNFLSFIGYADRGSLHLEARYNYEDIHTASVFAGWRFELGKKLRLAFTPLAGFVFGNVNGFVPGLEFEAAWKILEYYSETEYVFDFSNSENNYLYTWGELGINPFSTFKAGISYQRTILYQTGLELQKGIFASYSFWKLNAGVYYYNPFSAEQFWIVNLGIEF